MKNKTSILDNISVEDVKRAFRESPSVQKHRDETRRIFNSIPKEEWAKVLKR
jgi:hypothetical protein